MLTRMRVSIEYLIVIHRGWFPFLFVVQTVAVLIKWNVDFFSRKFLHIFLY